MSVCQDVETFHTRPKGEKWEVLMSFDGAPECAVECETQSDAEAVADAGPLVALARTQGRWSAARVRTCLEALARCGYKLHTSSLARRLNQFAEDMARLDQWA